MVGRTLSLAGSEESTNRNKDIEDIPYHTAPRFHLAKSGYECLKAFFGIVQPFTVRTT